MRQSHHMIHVFFGLTELDLRVNDTRWQHLIRRSYTQNAAILGRLHVNPKFNCPEINVLPI